MSKAEEEHLDIDSDEEEEKPKKVVEVAEPVVEEITTLANSDVITKYQEAAKIVQAAMTEVASLCVAGAKLLDICKAGDALIEQRAAAIFRGKNKAGKVVERGIAFPVCVSVNECVCHYSPLESEDRLPALVAGDLVKIDLGAHVDGFIAVGAHTVLVPGASTTATTAAGEPSEAEVASSSEPTSVESARADVVTAAWAAAEVAARLIKAGNTNAMVTDAIKQIAAAYNVRPIIGTVMHEMKRYVIDGKKVILLRDEENKVEACTFETYEVYSIDVAMSTGEGKPRQTDLRTTVFKRQVGNKYGLKIKASRIFFNEVNKRFPTLPFTVRAMGDESATKMGVRECVAHELLNSYPVLNERAGDQVAHVKFTVLLLPNGTVKVTGLAPPAGLPVSTKVLPEAIAAILSAEDSKSQKKSKKRSAKKTAGVAAAAVEAEEKA